MSNISEFFSYVIKIWPAMQQGALVSLEIFAVTLILSLPLGLLVALVGLVKFNPVRWLLNTYIWIMRGTPLLLQLFFVYFGLPTFGITFNSITSVFVAFALNYAAYFAEIFRAGIQSIDKGQYEASQALGMTYAQTMRRIIIPQTVKRIIPPLSNEVITLIKDTSLATYITVPELLHAAKTAVNRDSVTTAYLVAAIIYLFLTLILTVISKKLEEKSGTHENR